MDYYYEQCSNLTTANRFPNQRKLCKEVTKFTKNKKGLFPNVLTIRLYLGQQSLKEISKPQKDLNKQPAGNYRLTKNCLTPPKYHYTSKEFTPRKFTSTGASISFGEIKPFDIQKNLYEFFNYYTSILDRIALELNDIYSLKQKIQYFDFEKLMVKNQKGKFTLIKFDKLSQNSLLNQTIIKMAKFVENNQILRYRNVLSHRGLINIKYPGESFLYDKTIYIQINPNNQQSPCTKEVVKFCTGVFEKLIDFCDKVYACIIYDVQKNNKYPL